MTDDIPPSSAPDRAPLGSTAHWRPSEVDGPREAAFTPLLHWLVQTLRPAQAVRLGANEAQGAWALCQAAAAAGPGLRCRIAAGTDDPGHPLAERAVEMQRDIAVFEPDPEAALRSADAGSIGLLSIDAGLPGDLLRRIGPDVWRAVSPDGVVAVCGIEAGPEGDAARDLLRTLEPDRGRFEVIDESGRAAVVLHARPSLAPAAVFGTAGAEALAAALARLGDGPAARWTAAAGARALARAGAEIEELIAARDERHAACATALAQLAEERQAREADGEVRRRLDDARRELERAQAERFAETAALTRQLMKAGEARRQAVADTRQATADTRQAVADAKALAAQLDAAVRARTAAEAEARASEQRLSKAGKAQARALAEKAQLQDAVAAARAESEALIRSASWRATAPARRVLGLLRAVRNR